jgi:hypothetical protein
MRLASSLSVLACCALAGLAQAVVTVAAGPFFNPANQSRYYRITGGDWNQFRAFAVAMGGDLASIDDAAENTWVRANVVLTNTKPYIGLNDAASEGTLVWSDGSTSSYRNWRVGEPANSQNKDYVRYDSSVAGTWEIVTVNFGPDAIVEIRAANGVPAPIRVPAEQPTLASAFSVLPQVGANQVDLGAGTYPLTNTINLSALTLRGAGMGQTILQGPTGTFAAVLLFSGGSAQDMTIVNRSTVASVVNLGGLNSLRRVELTSLPGTADGSLLQVSSSFNPLDLLVIDSCLFNTSSVAMDLDLGSATVTSSIFRDLGAVSSGGNSNGFARFANCLFTRCGPTDLFDAANSNSIANSIFWDNSGALNVTAVSNSLVPGTASGTNFNGDPRFVNAVANNFNLQSNSPCIDRGLVTSYLACQPTDFKDFAGQPRAADVGLVPNAYGSLAPIDVGPIEFAPAACPGDLNSDGLVDDSDFQIFVVLYDLLICP